jgi:hypothetical protein
MIEIKNIFPECDSDTLLVKLITQRGNANHSHGISKVEWAMKRRGDTNEVLIALVDSDKFKKPEENRYLYSFTEIIVDCTNAKESLVLKKLPNNNRYAVFLCPEFEPWIWRQAQLAGIKTTDFGFPDLDSLYKVSKHFRTNESQIFKNFVNAVVQANPPGILLLRKWLVEQDFS